jgi:hypothetical protein
LMTATCRPSSTARRSSCGRPVGHRDELGYLLGKEDVQRLGLKVLAPLGREEQRLVAELPCPALDAEHDVADVTVSHALDHHANQRAGLRPQSPGSRRRPVLHALRNVRDRKPGGQADIRVALQSPADGRGRYADRRGYIFHRHPAFHGRVAAHLSRHARSRKQCNDCWRMGGADSCDAAGTGCRLIDCKLNDYMTLTTRQGTQYRFWVTDGDGARKKD